MRFLKLSSLAVVATVACIVAPSAMAENTALCSVHEDPCKEGNQLTSIQVHLAAGTIGLVETDLVDLLCLSVLGEATVGTHGAPQEISLTTLSFGACGTEGSGGSHSNCTVTSSTSESPTYLDLLKTALNLGELTALNGETTVKCTVFGFIKIECLFRSEELVFHVAGAAGGNHGMINSEGGAISEEGIYGGLCPEYLEITSGLLEPLTDVYITGFKESEEEELEKEALEQGQGAVDIVMCKVNGIGPGNARCRADHVWPSGKLMLGAATGVKFLDLYNVECNRSEIKGATTNEYGPPLNVSFTASSNTGCSGEGCPTATVTYAMPMAAKIEVAATDQYSLEMPLVVTIVCGTATCKYSETITLPLDAPGGGSPTALAEEVELIWQEGSECWKKIKLDAGFTFTGIRPTTGSGLPIKLLLYQLTP